VTPGEFRKGSQESIQMKRLFFIILGSLACTMSATAAVISISSFNSPYTQNFDTLASSGTSSVVPTGWAFVEAGSSPNMEYSAGPAGSWGDTFSFGNPNSSERAFGSVYGATSSLIGASFRNDTGKTITTLAISYFGEEWYVGKSGRVDAINFEYSFKATSLNNGSISDGTWTAVHALDFASPNTSAPIGALDGNAAGNRQGISSQITGLSFESGKTLWIRWTDLNPIGNDDGLAVDDFSLTAVNVVPEPVNVSLALFGGLAVGAGLVRKKLRKLKLGHV
jgi:hypothetical protein